LLCSVISLDVGGHGFVLGENGINCGLLFNDGSGDSGILGFLLLSNKSCPLGIGGGNDGGGGRDCGVNTSVTAPSVGNKDWISIYIFFVPFKCIWIISWSNISTIRLG
jgi:hypothetical protein